MNTLYAIQNWRLSLWTKRKGVKGMSRETANNLEGRVMSVPQAAALLGISRGSAYEAARRKEIPTIRIGRRLLVPSDALERLLSGVTAVVPGHDGQTGALPTSTPGNGRAI
jgi:excisionase family DNA binding protein